MKLNRIDFSVKSKFAVGSSPPGAAYDADIAGVTGSGSEKAWLV